MRKREKQMFFGANVQKMKILGRNLEILDQLFR
jgi:hypothetical protein